MTNKAALNCPTEGEEQATLFSRARMYENKYPQLKWMFHIPNEGKRSRTTGGRMRSEGMKSGVADIFLPAPSGEYHGLFIELKRLRDEKANEIKLCMGDAARGTDGCYKVTWPTASRSSFDAKRFAAEHREIDLTPYYKQSAYRTFKVTEAGRQDI